MTITIQWILTYQTWNAYDWIDELDSNYNEQNWITGVIVTFGKWKVAWTGFLDKEMTMKEVKLLLKWRGFKKLMRELLKEWITKEVIIDLGLEGEIALIIITTTPSATHIIRSSPCHEILACRWLVGCKWFLLLQMKWKGRIQRVHIVSTWSHFHYLISHDRITHPSLDG